MADFSLFENVFETKFCLWLLNDARKALSETCEFSRSNHHWLPHIVRASAPVLVRDYQPSQAQFILAKLVERGVIEHVNYAVMNYAWSRLSYIPWHRDEHSETAVTIYLNDVWDSDWGGLFLYREEPGQVIRAVAPQFNLAVRNTGNLPHATSMITPDAAEPRFTIQLFVVSAPEQAKV